MLLTHNLHIRYKLNLPTQLNKIPPILPQPPHLPLPLPPQIPHLLLFPHQLHHSLRKFLIPIIEKKKVILVVDVEFAFDVVKIDEEGVVVALVWF